MFGHADGLERGVDPARDLGLGDAEVLGAERDVVGDDARDHLVFGMLEHASASAPDRERCALLGGVHAEHADLARARKCQRVHELQQGRFARAVAA